MMYRYEQIPLARIDLQQDRFSCSYPPDLPLLAASVREHGVLNPITLMERGDAYVVTAGYRRALAARKANLEALECRVWNDPVPDEAALFLRNLVDNLSQRSLNLFERARAVRRLFLDLSLKDGEGRDACLRLLRIAREEREKERYLALDRLVPAVKDYVLARNLADGIALCFLEVEGEEAAYLVDLATRLRFTASQIRELITLGKEIAGRDDQALLGVLGRLEDQALPQGKEADPRQRDRFMAALKEKRFPDFTRIREALEGELAPIQGMAGMQITPPAFLEGDGFSLRFTFRQAADLEAGARALLRYAESPELARALAMLKE